MLQFSVETVALRTFALVLLVWLQVYLLCVELLLIGILSPGQCWHGCSPCLSPHMVGDESELAFELACLSWRQGVVLQD